MKMEKVLVVINPDREDQPALNKTLALVNASNAWADVEITLLSCEHTQYLVDGYYFSQPELNSLREEYLLERRALVDSIAEPIINAGFNVKTSVIWGFPGYQVIAKEAEHLNVDIVVHSVAKHGLLARAFMSHGDWQLVKNLNKPLLLVKETHWRDNMPVIAAVDPKHARHKPVGLDHKILAATIDIAERLNVSPYVLHACRPIPMSGSYPERIRVEHQVALDGLMDDFKSTAIVQLLVEESPEYALELKERELGAGIVVMGAISRSVLSDTIIGSTTEKIIDYLKSDVLVIKA